MSGEKIQVPLRWEVFAALLGLCFVLLGSASGAHAALGALDPSFGKGGIVDLRESADGRVTYFDGPAIAPDGAIYLLRSVYYSPFVNDLIRLRADGSRDIAYAGDGAADLPTDLGTASALAVDGEGRLVVGFADSSKLWLLRLAEDGAPDPSFGDGGRVGIDCACREATVRFEPGSSPGGFRVVVSRFERTPGRGSGFRDMHQTRVLVRELSSSGVLDAGFARDGFASVRIRPRSAVDTRRLPGGGELILAQFGDRYAIRLWKLGPRRGTLDLPFMSNAGRALTAFSRREGGAEVAWGGLVPRPEGRLDLIGWAGGRGFVMRLRRDGTLSRSFGRYGVKRLPWAPGRALIAPGGEVFTIGTASGDAVVGWIGPNGRPLESFGGGRGVPVPAPSSSGIALQPNGRTLLFDPAIRGCRSYCPPEPVLFGVVPPTTP